MNTMIGFQSPAKLMRRLTTVFALALMVVSLQSVGNSQEIQWRSDISQARKEAKESNKLVLLHFSASWSRPEKNLQTFVFSSQSVQDAFRKHVVAVKIDADSQSALVEEYGVMTVPFDVAISPEGRVVTKRKSPSERTAYEKMLAGFGKLIVELDKERKVAVKGGGNSSLLLEGRSLHQRSSTPFSPKSLAPKDEDLQVAKEANSLAGLPGKKSKEPQAAPVVPRFIPNPYVVPSPGSQLPIQNLADERAAKPGLGLPNRSHFVSNEAVTSANNSTPGEWKPRNSTSKFANQPGIGQPETAIHRNFQAEPQVAVSKRNLVPNKPGLRSTGNFKVTEDANPPVDSPATGVASSKPANLVDSTTVATFQGQPQVANAAIVTKSGIVNEGLANGVTKAKLEQPVPVKQDIALNGKCPVTLLTKSKWVSGDPRWQCVHQNRTYVFSSEENLKTFQSSPDAYSPILAGHDPVIFQESGKLVVGLEQHGVFMGTAPNQRIVLFDSSENREQFQAEPLRYLNSIRQATNTFGSSDRPKLR